MRPGLSGVASVIRRALRCKLELRSAVWVSRYDRDGLQVPASFWSRSSSPFHSGTFLPLTAHKEFATKYPQPKQGFQFGSQ
jgi:hypothetical protein